MPEHTTSTRHTHHIHRNVWRFASATTLMAQQQQQQQPFFFFSFLSPPLALLLLGLSMTSIFSHPLSLSLPLKPAHSQETQHKAEPKLWPCLGLGRTGAAQQAFGRACCITTLQDALAHKRPGHHCVRYSLCGTAPVSPPSLYFYPFRGASTLFYRRTPGGESKRLTANHIFHELVAVPARLLFNDVT